MNHCLQINELPSLRLQRSKWASNIGQIELHSGITLITAVSLSSKKLYPIYVRSILFIYKKIYSFKKGRETDEDKRPDTRLHPQQKIQYVPSLGDQMTLSNPNLRSASPASVLI